jgi:hypothetical protein
MKKVTFPLLIALVILCSGLAEAQYSWFYFGRSKEMLRAFPWQVQETPHFRIHHYSDDPAFIQKLAQTAEQAYTDLSLFLDVEVEKKIPLIFYTSHIDFEQTNLIEYMPPGVEAFAEPIGERMVLHGDRNFSDFARTLVHELGHIFSFQIFFKNISRSQLYFRSPPTWVAEGFSELITNNWDSFNLMTVRDAVIHERLPAISEDGRIDAQMLIGRIDYDMGHLVYEFIMHRYGRTGVRKFLYAFRNTYQPFRALGTTAKDFNFELRKYARERFKAYRLKENPEEYSALVGPEFPFLFTFSSQISPSGELVAVLTYNVAGQKMDLVLISMKTGKMVRSLTPGVTMKHDGIDIKFDPADGNSFAWDNRGEQVCYFARRSLVNLLVFNDVYNPSKLKMVPIPEIGAPASPFFHPETGELYFIGVEKSRSYLYRYNQKTEKVERLTDGTRFLKSAAISRDGRNLVMSIKVKEHTNLFTAPVEEPDRLTAITNGPQTDVTPIFDASGRVIYFSSDRDGAFNTYAIDLGQERIRRYTDVATANYFPQAIPGDPGRILVSSFIQGAFQLFKLDISKPQTDLPWQPPEPVEASDPTQDSLEKTFAIPSFLDQMSNSFNLQQQKNIEGPRVKPTLSQPETYKPFKNLSISSLPGFGLGYATDGSLMGYTSVALEDLMMDHSFNLLIYRIYGYQSYQLSYFNQRNRLKLFSNAYYFADAYYMPYSSGDSWLSVRKRVGGTIGLMYPLSREYRIEGSASLYYQEENTDNFYTGTDLPFSQYFDGPALPLTLSFVADDAGYSSATMGPLMGHSFKITLTQNVPVSKSFLGSTSFEADLRKYMRISNSSLLAARAFVFTSLGEYPQIRWMGGNNTIRSLGFTQLAGTTGLFLSAELRIPLIMAARTPIGTIGPIRGVFFADIGSAWFKDYPIDFFESGSLRLKDGFGSYGFGFMVNIIGYPMHFEWVWQLDNQVRNGGKRNRFNFWIGFDF